MDIEPSELVNRKSTKEYRAWIHSFENHSKLVPVTRIGAHFIASGLDITIMAP